MSSTEAEKSVTQREDGAGWDFACPRRSPDGSATLCGPQGEDVPFISDRWPTKKSAVERAREHLAEHDGKGIMSELHVFREKHGLYVDGAGIARVKGEQS